MMVMTVGDASVIMMMTNGDDEFFIYDQKSR